MFVRSLSRLLCCAALLPVLHANGAVESATAKDTPENRLKAIETRIGGRLGVAALDTGSGRRLEQRADERFPMCSTFKALAAAAVLHRVDEKKAQLSDVVPYTEGDLLEHAPIAKKHIGEGGLSLAALCAAAIEYSDNTAANLLLKTIGGPAGLTRFVRSLGDEKTRLDRTEPELNSALPGDERDTTTPRAMADTIRSLLVGDALSAASREQLESWLIANTTGGDLIRAGVPNDWKVGDKTGRGSNGATNDVAILRPPGKPPILLAIYSVESKAPRKEVQNAIAEVARIVAATF